MESAEDEATPLTTSTASGTRMGREEVAAKSRRVAGHSAVIPQFDDLPSTFLDEIVAVDRTEAPLFAC
jgi:hypothetical protein